MPAEVSSDRSMTQSPSRGDTVYAELRKSIEYLRMHAPPLEASELERPARMFGINDKRSGLTALRDKYGASVVGITLGEDGSMLLCGDTFIDTPGFPVPGGCKDTTGAGDSFRAGLLYGIVKGESIDESARMANAVAALKCRAIGARTSLPKLNELRSLLEKR